MKVTKNVIDFSFLLLAKYEYLLQLFSLHNYLLKPCKLFISSETSLSDINITIRVLVLQESQVLSTRNWRACMTRFMNMEEAIGVCKDRTK